MGEKLFKVIIIGDPTVGKTSFVQRYVQDTFKRDYKGTVGVDFALKIIKWSENQTVKLQLWDIAGNVVMCDFIVSDDCNNACVCIGKKMWNARDFLRIVICC